MVKVELHAHTNGDPQDAIGHSARALVDRALADGYGALAITLHDRHFDGADTVAYARDRGLALIPSVERTVEGRHVLLINFPAEAERVTSFDGVRDLKARHPDGLVIAPHPWFPLGKSLGHRLLEEHAALWDAVEINGFYTRWVDFNRPARRWARRRGIPLVGNCDVHQIDQLGTTFSLVEVEGAVTADSVCAAVRAGRVRVASRPLSHVRAAQIAWRAIRSNATGRPWRASDTQATRWGRRTGRPSPSAHADR